jgi:hypothetical protein
MLEEHIVRSLFLDRGTIFSKTTIIYAQIDKMATFDKMVTQKQTFGRLFGRMEHVWREIITHLGFMSCLSAGGGYFVKIWKQESTTLGKCRRHERQVSKTNMQDAIN